MRKLLKSKNKKRINNILASGSREFLNTLRLNRRGEVEVNNGGIINNNKLPDTYQEYFDDRILQIGTANLVGTNDLMMNGLVRNLPQDAENYIYQKVDSLASANVGMEFDINQDRDALDFQKESVPIPVFSKSWRFGKRIVDMQAGKPINVQDAYFDDAIKKVSLAIEETLFNGLNDDKININGKMINGYTDHPQRVQMTTPNNWLLSTNYSKVRGETLEMVKKLEEVRPSSTDQSIYMYYSPDLSTVMRSKSSQYSDTSIQDELRRSSIVAVCKKAPVLSEKTVVIVDLSVETIIYAVYQELSNIQWTSNGLDEYFMVFSIAAPVIKLDADNKVGIVHATIKS